MWTLQRSLSIARGPRAGYSELLAVAAPAGGQLEGVVEARFADLDWDASVLEQMR